MEYYYLHCLDHCRDDDPLSESNKNGYRYKDSRIEAVRDTAKNTMTY